MVTIRRSGTTEDSRFSSSISCSNIAVLPARAAFFMACASGPIEFWTELLIAGCDRAHNAVVTYHQGQGDKTRSASPSNGTPPHTISGTALELWVCPYPGTSANRFTKPTSVDQSLQQDPRRMRMQHVARLARTCAHDGRRSHGILINAKRRAARNHILAKKKRSGPLGA